MNEEAGKAILKPYFADPREAPLIFEQIMNELTSGTLMGSSEELREILRQAGLVQLWFFMRFILSVTGPYEKLNTALHLSMSNYAQSPMAMRPGARAAAFVFRSSFKTTIFGTGRGHWLVTRDGNTRFLFVSNTAGHANAARGVIKDVTETNEFYAWLYPECIPGSSAERWNADELVFPHRTRIYKEPSFTAKGIDSVHAGPHYTDENWDDLAGLEGLDKMMNVAAQMETARRNFRANKIPLLDEPRTSRIFYTSTIYGADDISMTEIIDQAKEIYGYRGEPEVQPVEGGEWDVYYRQIIEDGVEVHPDKMTAGEYEAMLIRDPWTALTQYKNTPRGAKIGGLEGQPRSCRILKNKEDRWVIIRRGDPNFGERNQAIYLSDCTVYMTCDPAGTDDSITSKSSRTSIGVWACDWEDNFYRIFSKVGYISDRAMYDSIFEGNKLFEGHILGTIFETVAMQKVLYKQLGREQAERGVWLALVRDPVRGSGDKEARIRHQLGGPLRAGKVWLADGCAAEFIEELKSFPSSKLDVLDESEKAFRLMTRPANEGEMGEAEEEEEIREYSASMNAFGW